MRNQVLDAARGDPRAAQHLAIGLVSESFEHHVLEHDDVDLAAAVVAEHGDVVVGIKVRMDARTIGAHGNEPLDRAIALGRRVGRPVMVHVGYAPPTIDEIVARLSPETSSPTARQA